MAHLTSYRWYDENKEIVIVTAKLTPLEAIRKQCAHCMGFDEWQKGVRECVDTICSLHPFRFGKDPSRKRDLTEEQRVEIGQRLRSAKGPTKR